MRNIAIIQARTGSTRLPDKVLLRLEDKTVLEHVIDRVSQSKFIDEVIVATTISMNDLGIVKICASKGIRVFCGSENDVLDRYYQAAKLFMPDNIVRITADCPLHDANVIDEVIERHLENDSDYSSNVLEETFPDGLDCEVMKFSTLREAWQEANLSSQREHVTQYIIHNEKYKKSSIVSKVNHGNERWTLDTEEDLLFIREIYKEIYSDNPYFNYTNIIDLLNRKPELRNINQRSIRNEGLLKSLKEDSTIDLDV